MGSGFSKQKKQMRAMQDSLSTFQNMLKETTVEGQAGNGLVKLTLNGNHEIKKLTIDPKCVDPEDVDGLQDLITAAYEDANKKLADSTSSMGGGMLGGLGGMLPGF